LAGHAARAPVHWSWQWWICGGLAGVEAQDAACALHQDAACALH
jgi:hypothetical protein